MSECTRYTCRYGFKEGIPRSDFGLQARVGDTIIGICDHGGKCCPHIVTGHFVEGSHNAYSEGKQLVRRGDKCKTTCPHCGVGWARDHSENCFVNGIPVHRVGDCITLGGGCGVTVHSTSRSWVNK